MKIRDRRLIAAAGWFGTRIVGALSASLRFDFRSVGSIPIDPICAPPDSRFIYALWHENFLIPITRFGNPSVAALVSGHADGRVLGKLIGATGMGVVYGSTSRGGVTAVRQLLRADVGHRHLAVTPDGPRGPRRVVQPGVAFLASRTAIPIVPIGVGHHRPWRIKSWDSFIVPRSFSRVRCLFGEPIVIPSGLSFDALTSHGHRVQTELDRLTATAQGWADTGQLDLPPALLQTRHVAPAIQHLPRTLETCGEVGREYRER